MANLMANNPAGDLPLMGLNPLWLLVGPVGLEPTTQGLKVRGFTVSSCTM